MNDCKDILKIVRGNGFTLCLQVEARRTDGTAVEDFALQGDEVLKLLHNGAAETKAYERVDNSIFVTFDGTDELGWYGLEMTGVYADEPWRWCVPKVFQIVETNERAHIPSWTILADDTYIVGCGITLLTSVCQADWDEASPTATSYIKNKPDLSVFYQKPTGGIPASDLSDSVRNSLNKAENAQPLLTAGTGITIDNNNVISATDDKFYLVDLSVKDLLANPLASTTIAKLSAMRLDPESPGKLILFHAANDSDNTLVPATITKYGSQFHMYLYYDGRNIHVTADSSNTTWEVTQDTLYVKPSGGIPESDMTEAVVESLAKVDTIVPVYQDIVDEYEDTGYYNFNNGASFSVGDTITINVVAGSKKHHAQIPVEAGETYRLTCNGYINLNGNPPYNARAYVVTDVNNVVLLIGGSGTLTDVVVRIPDNGAYLYVNSRQDNFVIKAELLKDSWVGLDSYSVTGRNVYDSTSAVVGKLTSSGIVDSTQTDMVTTDYIPLLAGEPIGTYIFNNNVLNKISGTAIAFYDTSKSFIGTQTGMAVVNFTSLSSCAYVRISFNIGYLSSMVMLTGDIVAEGFNDRFPSYGRHLIAESVDYVIPVKKTILADGDSIVYGHVPSLSLYPAYSDMVTKRSFIDHAAHAVGAKVRKFGISGSTLALKADGTNPQNALIARYNNLPDTGIDAVVIYIGTNDWSYDGWLLGEYGDQVNTTFYGALWNLCAGLRQKYPTQPIIFGTPIKRDKDGATEYTEFGCANVRGEYMIDYVNAIKRVCAYYSFIVVDEYAECGMNAWLQQDRTNLLPDGIHPTDKGHRMMAGVLSVGLNKALNCIS